MRPLWTAAQRRAAAGLVILVLLVASVRLLMYRQHVDDPQPDTPARAADLADRVDPNTADEATLAALPMVGPKRASDLVAFREHARQRRPDQPAFRRAEDLLAIGGFGPATVRQLEPYLVFPTLPTTRP